MKNNELAAIFAGVLVVFLSIFEFYLCGLDWTSAVIAGVSTISAAIIIMLSAAGIKRLQQKHPIKKKPPKYLQEFLTRLPSSDKFGQQFSERLSSIESTSLSDTIEKLQLPTLSMFRDSMFFKHYNGFYSSKEGLVAFSIIRDTWGTESPLKHPECMYMTRQFDSMSQDLLVLTEFPWLLPL